MPIGDGHFYLFAFFCFKPFRMRLDKHLSKILLSQFRSQIQGFYLSERILYRGNAIAEHVVIFPDDRNFDIIALDFANRILWPVRH